MSSRSTHAFLALLTPTPTPTLNLTLALIYSGRWCHYVGFVIIPMSGVPPAMKTELTWIPLQPYAGMKEGKMLGVRKYRGSQHIAKPWRATVID